MTTATDYEAQAQAFLDKHGIRLRIKWDDNQTCPKWDDGKCMHGDKYRVTLSQHLEWPISHLRKTVSFPFWNSYHDMLNGEQPMAYDVLAAISGDAYAPTNPDEVAEEYGPMKPSQAIAVARFAQRLQAFFTEQQLEDLAEIN